ncbi:MAG TPA: tRNA-binding protein [Limnochordales bacterium]
MTADGLAPPPLKPQVTPDVWERLDIRIGHVVEAWPAQGTHRPAYRLVIDFGPLGRRTSSAQITALYTPDQLVGRQVVAVVNLPPKRVGGFKSEVLVLGAVGEEGRVILLEPERPCPPGLPVG